MTPPFIVYGLPRSRTAWLAYWLSYGGRKVGHDTAIEADTVQGFVDHLWGLSGTVETGAMRAHRLLRHAMPDAKVITVRRDPAAVRASLAQFGIEIDAEIECRNALLDDIEAAGAARVECDMLSDPSYCALLFEHLTGAPFDFRWWETCARTNIQVDMPARLARIGERAEPIAALKADAGRLLAQLDAEKDVPFPRIALERWADIWPEAEPLALAHSLEVNAGVRKGHPFKMNTDLMAQADAAGVLRIVTARVNSRLVGYLFWTIIPDVESDGVIIGDQGPWYVADAGRRLHLGKRMMDFSLAMLRAQGIQSLQLHHQLNGRGARLGNLFARMGAVGHQVRYSLWIGD